MPLRLGGEFAEHVRDGHEVGRRHRGTEPLAPATTRPAARATATRPRALAPRSSASRDLVDHGDLADLRQHVDRRPRRRTGAAAEIEQRLVRKVADRHADRLARTAENVAGIRYAAYAATSPGRDRIGDVGVEPDRYASINRSTEARSASVGRPARRAASAYRSGSGRSAIIAFHRSDWDHRRMRQRYGTAPATPGAAGDC